jgi:hypothetical protein
MAGRPDDLAGYQERPRIVQVGSYRFIVALSTHQSDAITGELAVAPGSDDALHFLKRR